MKKTQDQRFLEYAGIITSGKLQERGSQVIQNEIYGIMKHTQWTEKKIMASSKRRKYHLHAMCVKKKNN